MNQEQQQAEMLYRLKDAIQAHRKGEFAKAKALYQVILNSDRSNVHAHNYLGILAHQEGDLATALVHYQQAVDLAPQDPVFQYNLAVVCQGLGRLEQAIELYQRVLAVEPANIEALTNLAAAVAISGQWQPAEELFRRCLTMDPENVIALVSLAEVLRRRGRLTEAEYYCRQALHYTPDDHSALYNYALIITQMGEVDRALAIFQRLRLAEPENRRFFSSFVNALNYHAGLSPGAVLQAHCDGPAQWYSCRRNDFTVRSPSPSGGRRLRLGYLSAAPESRSVGRFIASVWAHHDRRTFEIFVFNAVDHPPAETGDGWRERVDHWYDVGQLNDAQLLELIRKLGVHVLVDLVGHGAGNRLGVLALQAAPVQVSYLGYPNTTGLTTVDYRISDVYADPPEISDRYFTEQLYRLPDGFLSMPPPPARIEPAGPPVLHTGRVTFGSFNALPQLNQKVLATWAELLQRFPESRLVVHAEGLDDHELRRRFVARFAGLSVDPARILAAGSEPDESSRLRGYHDIDIALDPFPCCGVTSLCEALWMGVPVISLVGRSHAARLGYSVLSHIGRQQWAVSTEQAYIAAAGALAGDTEALARQRLTLRRDFAGSVLGDGAALTRQLETAFVEMWEAFERRTRPAPGSGG